MNIAVQRSTHLASPATHYGFRVKAHTKRINDGLAGKVSSKSVNEILDEELAKGDHA